jgi:hypothetical protein
MMSLVTLFAGCRESIEAADGVRLHRWLIRGVTWTGCFAVWRTFLPGRPAPTHAAK